MAPPRKKVNVDQIESLAAINCSYQEIASVVGINESTLTRRYAQVIKKGREQGKSSLKRTMWDLAVNKKNVTMCIWLSKQMLGYSDQNTQTVNINQQTNVTWDFRYGDESDVIVAEAHSSATKDKRLDQTVQPGDLGTAIGEDHTRVVEDDREADDGS